MERKTQNKETGISNNVKVHVTYLSIIMFLSVAFVVTLLTMKSSYDTMIAQVMTSGGSMPQGHPPVGTVQNTDSSTTQDAPAAGGPPPFVKKMLEKFRAALEKDPNDKEALMGLGNLYYDSGQYSKAVEYYEKVVSIDPKANNVRADLGTCYFYLNNTEKALEHYKIVLENEPSHLNARYNLGIIYKSQGKITEAKKELETMMSFLTTEEEKKKLQDIINNLDKKSST